MRTAAAFLAAAVIAGGGCRRREGGPRAAADGSTARVATAAPVAPEVPPPRGRQISLVYSSNVLGEYEHCGCPVHPLGGLGRRAAEVDRIRGESDAVIQVDAGDLFLPAGEGQPGWKAPAASEIE